jgi:hypothetical protein
MPSELTLLEQLDAAEAGLIRAQYALHQARRDPLGATRAAEVDLIAAAAHAQIAAARCLVSVEEIGDDDAR